MFFHVYWQRCSLEIICLQLVRKFSSTLIFPQGGKFQLFVLSWRSLHFHYDFPPLLEWFFYFHRLYTYLLGSAVAVQLLVPPDAHQVQQLLRWQRFHYWKESGLLQFRLKCLSFPKLKHFGHFRWFSIKLFLEHVLHFASITAVSFIGFLYNPYMDP